jgi:hypothetical protein
MSEQETKVVMENELLATKRHQIQSLIMDFHIMMRKSKKRGEVIRLYQDVLNKLEQIQMNIEELEKW